MERIENDDVHGNDMLVVSENELASLEDEVGPNAHGDLTEGFEKLVIELENGRELTFTGYGGGSVSLDILGEGLKGECLDCGKKASAYQSLNKVQGGPDNKAVYFCDDCFEDHPVNQILG